MDTTDLAGRLMYRLRDSDNISANYSVVNPSEFDPEHDLHKIM
jgi:hypothetical protein